MITRTFTKTTYAVKGIDANDKVQNFTSTLWDFEVPKSKRAFMDIVKIWCENKGLDFVKVEVAKTETEIRGVNEKAFFEMSEHIDR